MLSKFLQFIKSHQSDVILAISIVLITVISFNLGRISERDSKHGSILKNGIDIKEIQNEEGVGTSIGTEQKVVKKVAPVRTDFSVVASKKSTTKSYHFIWCPGGARILPENKLTFADETAAIAAGFRLASNCTR